MKKRYFGRLIAATLAMLTLLSFAAPGALALSYGTTQVRVNVRSSASQTSGVLTTVNKGTNVAVLGTSGEWTKVRTGKYVGYIRSDMLTTAKDSTKTTVKKDVKHDDVKILQVALTILGHYSGDISGNAGDKTIAAIKAFQTANQLKADGICGRATWSKLSSVLAAGESGSTGGSGSAGSAASYGLIRSGSRGTAVRVLQTFLIEKKYLDGNVDGVFGRKTTAALKAYQTAKNLKADGICGVSTWAAIKADGGLKTTAASSSDDNSSTYKTLRQGTSGDAVRTLQRNLKTLSYYTAGVDGNYGSKTVAAVKAFQKAMGLTQDGVAGSATQAMINTMISMTSTTLRMGSTGEKVKTLQTRLAALKYYSGAIDGKFGKGTYNAVMAFQKACGLKTDGVVGKNTYAKLMSSSAPVYSSSSSRAASSSNTGENADLRGVDTSAGNQPAPAPNGVQLLDWFKVVKSTLPKNTNLSIYDVRSGKTYIVRSFSNGNHADVEPLTKEDTAIMLETYGGTWSWDPRPVWVTYNGITVAASINGMPHAYGPNQNNGMDGQVCLHFLNSNVHNGNTAFAKRHQDAVWEAWEAAQNAG